MPCRVQMDAHFKDKNEDAVHPTTPLCSYFSLFPPHGHFVRYFLTQRRRIRSFLSL